MILAFYTGCLNNIPRAINTLQSSVLVFLKRLPVIVRLCLRMDNCWFEDIYTDKPVTSHPRDSSPRKKRNVRYTPSANTRSVTTHVLKRKRSPRVIENGNWAPLPRVCEQNARNACIVNPEEVEEFLNLISECPVAFLRTYSDRLGYQEILEV